MTGEERIPDDIQGLCMRLGDGRERRPEFLGRSHAHKVELDRQRGRRHVELLNRLRMVWRSWIPKDCDAGESWDRPLSSCSCFAAKSGSISESPVTFPPGRARFVTRPDPTGSATIAMTMGMVDVARFAVRVTTVLSATITSTSLLTRSATNSGTRA